MRGKARTAGLLALTAALFVLAFGASAAHATFGIEKWESLTCKENSDTPEVGEAPIVGEPPLAKDPEQCTGGTASKFFTHAAGHPNFGITDFTLNTFSTVGAIGFPEGFVKKIVVNTPEGLSVNPEATVECTIAQLSVNKCPPASQVGVNYLTFAAQSPPCTAPIPGKCLNGRVALPVYNVVPFEGAPSMVAFLTKTGATFIVGSLDPVDQHVIFTIDPVHAPQAGPPESPPIIGSRLVFNGRAGNGTYLTMPSNCAGGQITKLNVESYGPPYAVESLEDEEEFETSVGATGCGNVPFKPSIAVTPQGGAVDSPEATTVNVGIPWSATDEIANSYLKTAKVTLPEGMGLNPASANGLVPCTDAQFHYHTNLPIECPDASKIGTVEVQTPSLPADSLGGTVYVAQPLSSDPTTGEQFRIFIHVTSARYGVNVRLLGKVFPNLKTGQLTAVVDENPQATFSSFKLRLNGGPKGTLTTPGTCGPHTTTTEMIPWSENPDENEPSGSFTLTNLPDGGSCPNTLAERPFVPSYTAASDSTKAGAYSPLRVHIARTDGQQELKLVDVTLPKGLIGKLAGIPYCPDAAIAAAANRSGTAEQASSSCPAESMIGTTTTAAGSGTGPIKIAGKAFLAGPYKGAPLSLAIITPAVAGPYDLGTVVVRTALNVIPETAQVNAVSDVIPNVFGGVKLDIRSIDVNVDRSQFMRNPTNCSAQATSGAIEGGGADPSNPALFSSYPVNAPFAATECDSLKFKPKFYARVFGGKKQTRRAANPKFRAILEARKGDANLRRAVFVLPHSSFLDQGHIRTICTKVQLTAGNCPSQAIYGHAKATSPLLSGALEGPVYLTSSKHKLPDLLADLRGQVNIRLRGVISGVHGRLKTVFSSTPDVPVSKFILTMNGGSRGLLVNSENLCAKKQFGRLDLEAQNGKQLKTNRLRLNVPACHHR
jgi:hypothetical protein